ncbi:MAG TPA: phage holin family protein [Thermoleophilaceae bacterium]|nr:phage holin family protein [Thermoleophilaceae bacterium]
MAQHQPTDQPMAELVRQASEQTAALVRQELRLAQVELTEKGKRAGLGVGLVGTGTLLLLTGLAVLLVAVILALALVVPPWASALIVAVVLLAVAGVLALTGKKQVDHAIPPVPEEAMASTRRDVDEVKQRGRG